jgi:hypothetical protein
MPDLLAYAMDQLADAGRTIANGNTDMYKRFWNELAHTKIDSPKSEESARDALIDILRPRMCLLGIRVEPEGHMPRDKRADIVVLLPGMTLSVGLSPGTVDRRRRPARTLVRAALGVAGARHLWGVLVRRTEAREHAQATGRRGTAGRCRSPAGHAGGAYSR